MPRLTLTPAAVSLFTAAALSVALFAVSDASKAEHDVPEGSVSEASFSEAPSGVGPLVALSNQSGEESPGEAQYSDEDEDYDHPEPPQGVGSPPDVGADPPETSYHDFYERWLAREGDEPEVLKVKDTPSEGSAPGARAPAGALSVMEPPTPYSQIVDNASPRRFFSERGWKESSKEAARFGEDYEYIEPTRDASPAWFRVKIPTAGHYTVYARWPAAGGNNPAARFRVSTASGLKKAEVDQRTDGGVWVRLGAYEMEAGNRYSVQLAGRSKAEGRIVADAVMVVRGTQASPPRAPARKESGAAGEGPAGGSGTTAPGANVQGAEVVERARTHLGTPYRHSPPLPCEAYRSEDCSCLTRLVFGEWLTLPDDPVGQWQAGRGVEKSALLPGDLVFFKEAGESNPITHVAVYSGGGNIIHASSYWGRVVERPMEYVSGYYGAKRLS